MPNSSLALRRGALFLASLILTFLLFELAFRISDIRGHYANRVVRSASQHITRDAADRTPGVSFQYRPGTRFEIAYDSNPRGYLNERNGIVYQLNERGFRGPDFYTAKPADSLRVAVLGDSFTFGEGVRWHDTFAHRMQEQLRGSSDKRIHVLNLGQSSWGTNDEIAYLDHEARHFDPDLVLVVYVLNDADYAGDLDLYNDFRSAYEPGPVIRNSFVLSFVHSRVARAILGRRYVDRLTQSALEELDKWQRSMDLLARGDAIARSIEARFAVVIFPFLYELDSNYPFAELHGMIARFAREQQIPTLDLLPSMLGQPYADLWVHPSDPHPNELAHAIAADEMARFVLHEKLLEPHPPAAFAARH